MNADPDSRQRKAEALPIPSKRRKQVRKQRMDRLREAGKKPAARVAKTSAKKATKKRVSRKPSKPGRTSAKRPAAAKKTPRKKAKKAAKGSQGGTRLFEQASVREVRNDVQLFNQAIDKRWPTRRDVMEALLAKAGRIALATTDDRTFNRCFQSILKAEAQNQVDQLKSIADKLIIKTEETITPDQHRQILTEVITAERLRRERG